MKVAISQEKGPDHRVRVNQVQRPLKDILLLYPIISSDEPMCLSLGKALNIAINACTYKYAAKKSFLEEIYFIVATRMRMHIYISPAIETRYASSGCV